MKNNPGFDPKEIEQLKAECQAEGQSYVEVEDEQDLDGTGEYVQIQFVGKYEGKDVIYDAAIYTLGLHHSSLIMEEAEKKVSKIFKDFKPIEERTEKYKVNEEADEMLQEFIEELEEDESIKVSEHVEIDTDFEFGIGLEVGLNVTEITEEVIEDFIRDYNSDKLKLDTTLFSFKHDESED